MHADSAWLAQILSNVAGLEPRCNTNVHFQYAFSARSEDVAAVFQRHGIGVRVLGAAHGVNPDALRIVAPRADERERFAAAVADVVDELGRSPSSPQIPGEDQRTADLDDRDRLPDRAFHRSPPRAMA